MRKLKLQVQISIDGYISGPNGEMDWMVWNWDSELKKYVEEITAPVDCIVLGRNLAQGFIPHWANVAANPGDPEYTAGKKYTDTHKVVFTKTLSESGWANTVLAKCGIVDKISRLKNQNGKDIIAYGGGSFVSALIKFDLVDEFHLFVNPAALGSGMGIFNEMGSPRTFELEISRPFSCGNVLNKYRRST